MDAATIASLINFGSAGAVIIVVIIFLNYIGKRDQEWRDFFTVLNKNNVDDMNKLAKTIDSMIGSVNCLSDKFDEHDNHVEDRIKKIQVATRTRGAKKAE